ncbi:WD40-repeat-containing domain protein [Cercophora samala]|uniref:WD40-repeat-containing domain protein n=1 Tax=Cercophora samala TaxID=330535 RepID=A0AA39Z6D0_9PEZI|nr:WD40-repeat-containing domain protein [Cercophora samala]
MDDEYASSENEADELMEEAEDIEADNDAEDDNDNEDEEQDDDEEAEGDAEAEPEPEAENEAYDNNSQSAAPDGTARDHPGTRRASAASGSGLAGGIKYRPVIRPEYTTAAYYDIVPTMAAPQATSINAIAITPDQRYWMTGGSDGYVRKYDGIGTINGKQQLTVAQRHPFVDSVVKAGILMGYWGNEEPTSPGARAEEAVLSPVYSLAVHSEALWLLSGLESGGINLYSVRHDEGKRIFCLREGGHTNAVSVLQLAPDEKSVLSGSWDKTCLDWDLNNGQVIRRFDGSGGQISAIEPRPTGAAPIPAEASEVMVQTDTFQSNNDKPPIGNFYSTAPGGGVTGANVIAQPDAAENTGSPEHESLFGSPAGSLFGDNDTIGGGGGAYGDDDDDNEFSRAMDMEMNNHNSNGMGQSTDFSLDDVNMSNAPPLDVTNPIDVNTAPPPTQNGITTTTTTNPLDANTVSETSSHTLQGSNSNNNNNTNSIDESVSMSLDFSAATTEAPPPPSSTQQTADTTLPDAPPSQPAAPATILFSTSTAQDPSTSTPSTFLSASIDGTLRIWDKRVPDPVARINNRRGVPPWCMGACWSLSGNEIYCGRRNGTVEEFSIHKASSSWQPERALKLPNGSGAVSAVRPMPNGRHIICASHDILRLYDLQHDTDLKAQKHSKVPFTIVPGPPRAGVISCLYLDPTSRIMISAAGTRGWEGTSTEVLVGYEIHANN